MSDPGEIKKNNSESWLDIVESAKKLEKICPYCKVELDRFSKHCFLCNKCIEIYDHHCHWINNCVGNKNKPFFIAFVLSLWFNLIIDCYIIIQIFFAKPNGKRGNYILENYYFKVFYGGIVFIISLFFVFPVSYLIYMQIKSKDNQREVQTYLKEVKELTQDLEDDKSEKLID